MFSTTIAFLSYPGIRLEKYLKETKTNDKCWVPEHY